MKIGKKIIIFSVSVVFLSSLMIILRLPSKQIFDGYVLWGREVVIFSDKIINDNGVYKIVGTPIHLEENKLVKDLYEKAFIIKMENENNIKIIRAKFYGVYYKNGKNIPVSPYNLISSIKVIKVVNWNLGEFK